MSSKIKKYQKKVDIHSEGPYYNWMLIEQVDVIIDDPNVTIFSALSIDEQIDNECRDERPL